MHRTAHSTRRRLVLHHQLRHLALPRLVRVRARTRIKRFGMVHVYSARHPVSRRRPDVLVLRAIQQTGVHSRRRFVRHRPLLPLQGLQKVPRRIRQRELLGRPSQRSHCGAADRFRWRNLHPSRASPRRLGMVPGYRQGLARLSGRDVQEQLIVINTRTTLARRGSSLTN